jgi:hypothetical protein
LSTNTELWGTATIPTGTYVSALITLDYTSALITTVIGGTGRRYAGRQPSFDYTALLRARYHGRDPDDIRYFGHIRSLESFGGHTHVCVDECEPDGTRLRSGRVRLLENSGTTPEYIVNPFVTLGILPSDNKLIRIRGPLINTNNTITTGGSAGTYSVYVRPFHDEVDNLGSFSLFSTADTIFTINGVPLPEMPALPVVQTVGGFHVDRRLYDLRAGLQPANQAYAGTFYPVYVVAGSTLEDNYTEGLSGDVVARNGNLLTLRRSTLFINIEEVFDYESTDTFVQLGTGTLVTADDTTLTGLNYDSIGVGQHIEARGIYTIATDGSIVLDATGTSATNTGSVRLISTQLYGSLTSTATGSLTMNLSAIDGWPVSSYTFAGNGTSAAADPVASAFVVNTGSLALPSDLTATSPVFLNGLVTAFGSAPPDFTATAVNSQASVQVAGGTLSAPGTESCGLGSQVCQPASLRVLYSFAAGAATPFVTVDATGFTLDKTNAALISAVVAIGPQTFDLTTLPTNLTLVPTSLLPVTPTPTTSTTQPSPFGPQYSVGNPVTSTITETATTASTSLHVYSSFASFFTEYGSLVSPTNPVLQLTARGVYDSTTNTFTATELNVVL